MNTITSIPIKVIFLLTFILVQVTSAYSQTATHAKKNWSVSPFSERVFIENNGQLDDKSNPEERNIRYAFLNNGVQYFFTSNGWTYKKELKRENIANRLSSSARDMDEEEREQSLPPKITWGYVHMNWEGANAGVKIVASDEVSGYYNYINLDTKPPSTITANAYSKITYINLYDKIDVEFTFPQDKQGIEYNIILHSGADVAAVKMLYPDATSIVKDVDGNLQLKTAVGVFVDHAPVAHDDNGHAIASSFKLKDNRVTFDADVKRILRKTSQNIIIDPWVIDPGTSLLGFRNYDAGYDVDYDYAGNVYAYGGRDFISGGVFYTYRLIKYDKTGSRQWTTSFNFYDGGCGVADAPCYGDFAVDASNGSCYMVEGFRIDATTFTPMGARVVKIDTSGNIIAIWDPGSDTRMDEFWRIVYNSNIKQGVIAGGGTASNYQVCILDTTLSNLVPVNILSTSSSYQDFTLLAIDNDSNCFMATSGSSVPAGFDNKLLKTSSTHLLPVSYIIDDNYAFHETSSIPYVIGDTGATNGFNGIAVNANYLYTYDGNLLQQWDKYSGSMIQSRTLGGTAFASGGLDVDSCGYIYTGFGTSILQLDPSTLNTISTIEEFTAYGNVFDLKIGPHRMMYATGKGFVASIGLNCLVTGAVNTGSVASFQFYPNPVSNQLILHSSAFNLNESLVSIKNILGQTILFPTALSVQKGDALIDVSNLSAGIYFLQLKTKDVSIVKKFLKE